MKKKNLFFTKSLKAMFFLAVWSVCSLSAQAQMNACLRIEQPGTVKIGNPYGSLFENKGRLPDQKYYWEFGCKNYLGYVNTYANPDASTTLYLDTAFVNRGPDNARPQYLLAVGIEKVETQAGVPGYVRGRYLINASDSARNSDGPVNPYLWEDRWTRLVFTDAIHANDALYILSGVDLTAENAWLPGAGRTVDISRLDGLAEEGKIHKIALDDNRYKMCTFSFPLQEAGSSDFFIQSDESIYVGIVNGVPVANHIDVGAVSLFSLEFVEDGDPTGNEAVAEPVRVHAANGVLTVQSPAAEEITLYNAAGAQSLSARKEAGRATFSLDHLLSGVYIVKGSSGWTQKIIRP